MKKLMISFLVAMFFIPAVSNAGYILGAEMNSGAVLLLSNNKTSGGRNYCKLTNDADINIGCWWAKTTDTSIIVHYDGDPQYKFHTYSLDYFRKLRQ